MARFVAMVGLIAIGCAGEPPAGEVLPAEPAAAPAVVGGPTARIYPSVRDIPSNGLVFRMRWSEPMQLGPHGVVVLDAHGEPIAGAIPRLRWDEELREATVAPVGLTPGRLYTLRVGGFTSAEGLPAAVVEQRFVLRPEDTEPPSGADLAVLGKPTPGGREPLRVRFPEAMRAESLGALTVLVMGETFDGAWDLVEEDAVAEFVPAAPWPGGLVHVAIGAGVTDLAGNEMQERPTGMLSPGSGA